MFNYRWEDVKQQMQQQMPIAGGILAMAAAAALATRYRVCQADQMMVRTGIGIRDMLVSKHGLVLPFQKYQFVTMNPRNYAFVLHNMSKEKVPFKLPCMFTVGPADPAVNLRMFKNYAQQLSNLAEGQIGSIVQGIIHGETRILSASLTVEEMFNDKEKFKCMVADKIQKDLDQLGLVIKNANIEEMGDIDRESTYFYYRSRKALETANNEAKVAVAEATKMGDIGEAERKAQTRQKVAMINAETTRVEYERARDIAESKRTLEVYRAEFKKQEEIAFVEAHLATNIRKMELEKELESKRIQTDTEAERAKHLVHATVEAESAIMHARGQAESIRIISDAKLYEKEKEAQATKCILMAEAEGIEALVQGSSHDFAKFYLGMCHGLFTELASESAKAIQGLQPKIHVWDTGGSSSSSSSSPYASLRDLVKAVPPMLDVLKHQTGITLESVLGEKGEKKN